MILRRDFITLLGGAATWSLAARAQQRDRVRRIGMLQPGVETDPLSSPSFPAFTQALAGLGWTEGRNGWTFVMPAVTSIGCERSRRSCPSDRQRNKNNAGTIA
jgi:hypothetical protein